MAVYLTLYDGDAKIGEFYIDKDYSDYSTPYF